MVYLKKCFETVGVKASISKATSTAPPRLIIANFDSFMKLYEVDAFELHPYKGMRLLLKLLNYKMLKNNDRKRITHELMVLKNKVKKREKPFKSTYTKTYLAQVGD